MSFRFHFHRPLLVLSLAFLSAPLRASDPYLLFERFHEADRIPRMMSTVDFGLSAVQPEELDPIEGDFDRNGIKDLAVAGTYTLPGKGGDFFLLVIHDLSGTPTRTLLKTGTQPYYLHKPGSTGPSDPGDQAFSYSHCINCSTGTDVYWSAASRRYVEQAWLPGARIPVPSPAVKDVDPKVADEALRIAGRLKDVKAFVDGVGRRGGELLTRIAPSESGDASRVRVSIYERTGSTIKEHFLTLDIDTVKKRVMSRSRQDPSGASAPGEPAEPDTVR